MERRLQAWIHHTPYHERYEFVPLSQISGDFQHACNRRGRTRASTQHHGFDWHAMEIAAEGDMEGGRNSRRVHPYAATGLKTCSSEPTARSFARAPSLRLSQWPKLVLGKQRILELYLNVVEWGPGVYGAESACRYYYRTSARNIDRQQSARLAAILPLPLKRRPDQMNHYSGLSWSECAKWVGNRTSLS